MDELLQRPNLKVVDDGRFARAGPATVELFLRPIKGCLAHNGLEQSCKVVRARVHITTAKSCIALCTLFDAISY